VLRRPVKRTRPGRYQLHLSKDERELLRSLPVQLNELLDRNDPSLERLFPPAYENEPELDAEYQRLMREDLVERRRVALDAMTATLDADSLSEEELTAWLGALNDFRLVLGTQLGVTEDEIPEETPEYGLYHYLTYLEDSVVTALAGW
jgi:hypothetical protein